MNSAHWAPIRFSNGCQFAGSTSIAFLSSLSSGPRDHRDRATRHPGATYPTACTLSSFSGIGHPRAARIISLVQPAQQMYFWGTLVEIAKLSPHLSRPAAAHEGQRVTQ